MEKKEDDEEEMEGKRRVGGYPGQPGSAGGPDSKIPLGPSCHFCSS